MITSTSNDQVKAVKRLHTAKGRREAGHTLVEGPNGLEALHAARVNPVAVYAEEGDGPAKAYAESVGTSVFAVSHDVLRAMSNVQHPIGPVVVIETPKPERVRAANTVALVDVGDPGNVGTVLRTAVALGWDVSLYGECADPWSPKSIRASAGTALRALVARGDDPIRDAAAHGLVSIAMVVDGGEELDPASQAVMLMLGSEAHGLSPHLIAAADRRWTIPMTSEVESLNVAAAAAIGMHALS